MLLIMFSKGQNTIGHNNKLKLIKTKMQFLNDYHVYTRG